MTTEEKNYPRPDPPYTPDRVHRCPTCAAFPPLRSQFLDSRTGRTIRLYECECGERVWDD